LKCNTKTPIHNTGVYSGNYEKLIIAINKEDTTDIRKIVIDNNLNVNHRDSKYGISLLAWTIYNRKLNSTRCLLTLGANPNQKDSTIEIVPPITIAAGIDTTSKFLKLLLDFGANANETAGNIKNVQFTESTPLNAAAATSLENVKLLVDRGADINYSPFSNFLPVTTALLNHKIDVARYLVIEKEADVQKVFTIRENNDTAKIDKLLRLNVFELNTVQYKEKMEIVAYLKKLGINYNAAPIPKFLYNNYSKEFLEKY